MLQLKNITKKYKTGDSYVQALSGVSIDFRESEFVSILGPSGCGKTTLLNIIGGLDRYTKGDLLINGKSTKSFKDSHWDTYRNHSVGFVFQSYNLIPHQTVLSNVELALTLSGVSKTERRRRAIEALEKVGLGDQLKKKPNQMSGGQMQRVAIARAIVNDPDILLADEPTGALDTQTSIQIMEILREIAKDKLVIMVTHNPELAEQYSTRIVRLLDGTVIDDSNPFEASSSTEEVVRKTNVKKGKKASMSFLTALSLSVNNLMTKKGRTFMTSFAGSIGIIGIALILALSSGINAYIALVQEDTLSTYPLTIQEQAQDMSAMMGAMTEVSDQSVENQDPNLIYVDDSMGTMMSAMSATVSNNLEKFKEYIDKNYDELAPHLSSIQYTYDFDLQVFTDDGKTQVNPTTLFDNMGDQFSGVTDLMDASGMNFSVLSEMIDNQELLEQQYDLVRGEWPDQPNEIVLVISKDNQISKMALYMLGFLPQSEVEEIMKELMTPGSNYTPTPVDPIAFDEFFSTTYRLYNTSDFYIKKWEQDGVNPDDLTDPAERAKYFYTDADGVERPIWVDRRNHLGYKPEEFIPSGGMELKISGIIRPAEGTATTSISTNLAYTKALTDYILEQNTKSEIIHQQKATPTINVLTGTEFERTKYTPETIHKLIATIDDNTMNTLYAYMTEQVHEGFVKTPPVTSESFMAFVSVMNDEEKAQLLERMTDIVRQMPGDLTQGIPSGDILLAAICQQLSTETLTVTPKNLPELLPILNKPMEIPEGMLPEMDGSAGEALDSIECTQSMFLFLSLQKICGEEAMTEIYDYMNKQLMSMSVNEDNFSQLLSFVAADEDTFNTLEETLYSLAPQTDATLDSNLKLLGDAEKAKPASINFYAKDFESKDAIEAFITDYNNSVDEVDQMKYTDVIGLLMTSVTTIINVISYVLIAFVSISLVVSSIMIGIITYISVLERTKEIGILRAMGASKKDISRVFNAETLIVGLVAGLIGILVTIILCFPINAIVRGLTGIPQITAYLPWQGAIILVAISMILTIIAGLIPSFSASKKDPVVALRSE